MELKRLDLELGFSQWGFKQQPNESYAEYAKRIANSKVWETEDQAVNDLTTAGAEKLNQMTTLNPISSIHHIQVLQHILDH